MSDAATCPCCGGVMPEQLPVAALEAVPMPESERIILSEMVGAYPLAVTTDVLRNKVWAHDWTGGPLEAANGIGVRVHRLNQRIKPLGWRVNGHSWNGRKLERLEVAQQ